MSDEPLTSALDRAPTPSTPVGSTHPGCECEIQTETGPTGAIVVLHVVGEIDLASAPLLRTALAAALDRAPADLVVDLAAVSFLSVPGFALIAATAHTARTRGIGYAVSGLSSHMDRVATILWPDDHLTRYRSTAAAVTAIRIVQAHRPGAPELR